MPCIFCKIIAKEIPNHTVYEDANVLAFLDIFPCSKGHTVVIPKRHAERMTYLSAAEQAAVMLGVSEVMKKIDTVLSPAGMNVGWNDRAAAGQAVPHVHVHIVPRYEGDGGGSMHSIVKSNEKIEVGDIARLFLPS
jgi:histidine triad (HIT) family protein